MPLEDGCLREFAWREELAGILG